MAFPQLFSTRYCLITTCDSSTQVVSSIGSIFQELLIGFDCVGEFVLLEPKDVPHALAAPGILTHFDELYLLPALPGDFSKTYSPIEPHWTSERCQFNVEAPRNVVEGFNAVSADAYFSDGIGLNFLTHMSQLRDGITDVNSAR